MKTKWIYGGLSGGITLFLLGWIVFGMLLPHDTMATFYDMSLSRPDEEMLMWALFLSNLMYGSLLSVVLDWAGSTTWLDGMKRGAVIGLLMTAAYDLNFYAMTTMFLVPTGIFVDMLIFSFLMACSGGVIGFVYGKLNK
ncbi:MAG: hypothetical protein IT240_10750 [Bacteroidia bacterium]|nr:hypothetical protein [Bacteroidia bacterium]MCC6769513.1 hypothetical protein [Bacteroidia bacterium]